MYIYNIQCLLSLLRLGIKWYSLLLCCILMTLITIINHYLLMVLSCVTFPWRGFFKVSCDIWATSWQNKQCGCAPSEDSDQPSLIRVFAVRMKKGWTLNYPQSASEGSDQTGWVAKDPTFLHADSGCPGWSESSLGAHCWFCHEAAHFLIFFAIKKYKWKVQGMPKRNVSYAR